MPKSKKVIIATSEFPPQPGGIGNHALNLAKYLSKNDVKVLVLADIRSKDGKLEQDFDNNLDFEVIRMNYTVPYLFPYLNRILKLMTLTKSGDFVIATGKFSLWNVAFCKIFRNINSIAVVHGSEVNFKPFFLRKSIDISLKSFDTIIAVSRFTEGLMSHLNRQIRIIPNGIDIRLWKSGSQTYQEERTSVPRLITVGRLSDRKGQLNVIRNLPVLLKNYPKLQYHCVGISNNLEKYKMIAKNLGVEKHVFWHSTLSHSNLKLILKKADIFVMLSSEQKSGDVEGFGIAILEANALGIPAIGSKGCGIEDAIVNGRTGYLINPESAIEFENAIASILRHKEEFKKESEKWAKYHDWDYIIKSYLEVLN